jgi:hypothetical protein
LDNDQVVFDIQAHVAPVTNTDSIILFPDQWSLLLLSQETDCTLISGSMRSASG